MKRSGIYIITNILDNKFYVGSSINLSNRLWDHKNKLKKNTHCNPHLQRAWNKHGEENFIFEVLEECENILEKECFYTNFFKSHLREFGYNIECFSRGRKLHSEESKLKISKANKGKIKAPKSLETRQKISQSNKGRILTEEHKLKIAQGHIGKKRDKFSEEWIHNLKNSHKLTKHYFDLYSKEGLLLKSELSMLEIQEILKVSNMAVRSAIKNNHYCKNHIVVYKNIIPILTNYGRKKDLIKRRRSVKLENKNETLIFQSVFETGEYFKVNASSISQALKRGYFREYFIMLYN